MSADFGSSSSSTTGRIRGKSRMKDPYKQAPRRQGLGKGPRKVVPRLDSESLPTAPDDRSSNLEWAVFYIVVLGWALVPVAPKEKRPLGKGWNRPRSAENPEGYITSVGEAEKTWGRNPEYGIGLVLGPSGICSIDIDNLELAREAFERVGIDLDGLLESGVRIEGGEGRAKLICRVPEGFDLKTKKFSVPNPEDPDGKAIMVFELRTGPVQDVLPPSIHPGTGKPYEWVSPPWRKEGIDELS